MSTKKTTSEVQTLEQYRVALENAETQPQIASTLAELGYDATVIGEGKTILTETCKAYNLNKTEDDETNQSYAIFTDLKQEIEKTYSLHRKKAKVIYRNDQITLEKLGIKGSAPKAYVKWLEITKKFYTVASTDTEVQNKLVRLKITSEDIQAVLAKITKLETARADYLREKGESQDATKIKDSAFAKIDDWMSEFYAVAKIGLEDHPQLLEALGKTIKN